MSLIITGYAFVSGLDNDYNGPGFTERPLVEVTKLSPKVLHESLHNQYTTYRVPKITTMTLGRKGFQPVAARLNME
jgi:hypothetical protein